MSNSSKWQGPGIRPERAFRVGVAICMGLFVALVSSASSAAAEPVADPTVVVAMPYEEFECGEPEKDWDLQWFNVCVDVTITCTYRTATITIEIDDAWCLF